MQLLPRPLPTFALTALPSQRDNPARGFHYGQKGDTRWLTLSCSKTASSFLTEGVIHGGIAIADEQIVAVGADATLGPAKREIDVREKIINPRRF
jgi:cytosine/adenosine deaminase-related metal-dependent hydrolase